MKYRALSVAAAAALAVGGCASGSGAIAGVGDSPNAAPGSDMTPETGEAYVALAASSDLYEIESSRLALTRTQDAALRPFAQMMIDHHTQTTQQLTAAAQSAGIRAAPKLLAMHAQMFAQLRAASDTDFDRLYRTQQLRAHEMAVELHGNFAAQGDVPALRTVAAAAVPIVTQHLAQVRQMQN